MDVLEEAMKEMIKDVGFSRILNILVDYSRPDSTEEAVDMMDSLMAGLVATVAYEGLRHVTEHEGGYDCATGIIEVMCNRFREQCDESLSVGMKAHGFEEPTLEDHNTTVFKEILSEMEKNNEVTSKTKKVLVVDK